MSYPSDRLAAFVAHCLNSDVDETVRLDPGMLYAQITDALASRYAEPLLYYPVYAARMSREEAATRYFDRCLARRLLLSGRVELSVAHRLLERMCQRSAEALWSPAGLVRAGRPSAESPPAEAPAPSRPPSLEQCAQRLAALPDTLSSGSASATIRERSGPIRLHAGAWQLPVPEELSGWDAINCGPRTLAALAPGEPFNRFCGVLIDWLRTANRPFQELLGLGRGLCPFDWEDTLSIQQTRALRRFIAALAEFEGNDTLADWSRAFALAPVSGFTDAEQLWRAEIGLALRHALALPPAAATALEIEAEAAGEFLPEPEFIEQLDLLAADGVVSPIERWLLEQLYQGAALESLARKPAIRLALRHGGHTLESLTIDLNARVAQWQRTLAAAPSA